MRKRLALNPPETPGEGRRQSGDGMATDLREQHGTERNEDYISRVDGETRIDAGKNQSGCDQPMRHAADKPFERRRKKAAAFSHSHSDHGDQEPFLKVQKPVKLLTALVMMFWIPWRSRRLTATIGLPVRG